MKTQVRIKHLSDQMKVVNCKNVNKRTGVFNHERDRGSSEDPIDAGGRRVKRRILIDETAKLFSVRVSRFSFVQVMMNSGKEHVSLAQTNVISGGFEQSTGTISVHQCCQGKKRS